MNNVNLVHGSIPSTLYQQETHNTNNILLFDKILAPKAERLKFLFKREILDEYSVLTEKFQNYTLPPFTQEENRLLLEELEKPFEIEIEGEKFPSSIGEILRNLCSYNNEFKVIDIFICKNYITYFLFHKTGYARRIYEDLGIEEQFLKRPEIIPPEIEIRLQIEMAGYYEQFYTEDGLYIPRTNIPKENDLDYLAKAMVHIATGCDNREFIDNNRDLFFKTWEPATNQNLSHLLCFKNNSVKIYLDGVNSNNPSFTTQGLLLSIRDLLFHGEQGYCQPVGCRNAPLQVFFDYDLNYIRAINPKAIGPEGLFEYLYAMNCNGSVSKQKLQFHEISLQQKLFDKLCKATEKDSQKIKNLFIKSHPEQSSHVKLFFILNTGFVLQKKGLHEASKLILEEIKSLKLEGIAAEMQDLILNGNVSLECLFDLVHIASFLILTRKQLSNDLTVEMELEDFVMPLTQFNFREATLSLRSPLLDAFKRLACNYHLWKSAESELANLFLLICPPLEVNNCICEVMASSFDTSMENLQDQAQVFVQTESPLLKYIGIVCNSSIPSLEPKAKEKFAEMHGWNVFQFFGKILEDEKVKDNFFNVLEFPKNREEWISKLLEKGNYETGLRLCKGLLEEGNGLEYAAGRVIFYAKTDPEIALQFYIQLKKQENFAQCNLAFLIIDTINQMMTLEKLSLLHNNLFLSLGNGLESVLNLDNLSLNSKNFKAIHFLIAEIKKHQVNLASPLSKTCILWMSSSSQKPEYCEELITLVLEIINEEGGSKFVSQLIPTLAKENPFLASKLYDELKNKKLTINISIAFSCMSELQKKQILTIEDENLLLQFYEDLSNALQKIKLKKGKISFSVSTLSKYLAWLEDKKETKKFNVLKQCCETICKKNKLFAQAWLSKQLNEKEKNTENKPITEEILLKNACNKNFSREKLFIQLLHYFITEKEKANPLLFEFIQDCYKSSKDWKWQNNQAIELLKKFFLEETLPAIAKRALLLDIDLFLKNLAQKNASEFQSLLSIVIESCLELEDTKELFELNLIIGLIYKFPAFLKNSDESWIVFFEKLRILNPHEAFNIFRILEQHQVISIETTLSLYQMIYATTVASFASNKGEFSEKIVTLIENNEKHQRIYSKLENKRSVISCWLNLLLGGIQHLKKHPKIVPQLQKIYSDFSLLYEELLDQECLSLEDKECYTSKKATTDAAYLRILFSRPPHEIISFFEQLGKSNISHNYIYQKECFYLFYKLLVVKKYNAYVDVVLQWLDLRALDWKASFKKYQIVPNAIIKLMLENPTPIRLFRSLQFWLCEEQQKLNPIRAINLATLPFEKNILSNLSKDEQNFSCKEPDLVFCQILKLWYQEALEASNKHEPISYEMCAFGNMTLVKILQTEKTDIYKEFGQDLLQILKLWHHEIQKASEQKWISPILWSFGITIISGCEKRSSFGEKIQPLTLEILNVWNQTLKEALNQKMIPNEMWVFGSRIFSKFLAKEKGEFGIETEQLYVNFIDLWHQTVQVLEKEKPPIASEIWHLGIDVMLKLLRLEKTDYDDKVGDVLNWVRNYCNQKFNSNQILCKLEELKKQHEKEKNYKISDNQNLMIEIDGINHVDLWHCDLLYFGRQTQDRDTRSRQERILFSINNMPRILELKSKHKMFDQLLNAIINSNRFNQKEFTLYVRSLWQTIVYEGAETKSKFATYYPIDRYIQFKISLLGRLINALKFPYHFTESICKFIDEDLEFLQKPVCIPYTKNIAQVQISFVIQFMSHKVKKLSYPFDPQAILHDIDTKLSYISKNSIFSQWQEEIVGSEFFYKQTLVQKLLDATKNPSYPVESLFKFSAEIIDDLKSNLAFKSRMEKIHNLDYGHHCAHLLHTLNCLTYPFDPKEVLKTIDVTCLYLKDLPAIFEMKKNDSNFEYLMKEILIQKMLDTLDKPEVKAESTYEIIDEIFNYLKTTPAFDSLKENRDLLEKEIISAKEKKK